MVNQESIRTVVNYATGERDYEKYGFTSHNRNERLREIFRIIHKHKVTKGISPEKLRMLLEDLGPTFVKIGQLLSMRSEILPREYCDELAKLRAHASPISYESVLETLEREYARPLNEIFSSIDQTPLGSASVAQVHKATLLSGQKVALKVQRPGVQSKMAQDISIMRKISHRMTWFVKSDEVIDFEHVVEELWSTFQEETDFLLEAKNLEDFAEFNAEVVYIDCPCVYREYCTEHVLAMEYIDGVSIADTQTLVNLGYDLQEIGNKLVDNYTKQVLDDGYFHADPHQGNIFIHDGRIVYIDLGMMGRLSSNSRVPLGDIIHAVGQRDIPKLKEALLRFAAVSDTSQIDHARFLSDLDGIVGAYGDVNLEDFDVGAFLTDLFALAQHNHVHIPTASTMVAKGFVTLEGVLDECLPSTNIIEIIARHLGSRSSLHDFIKDDVKGFALSARTATKNTLEATKYSSEMMKMLTHGQLKFNIEATGSDELLKKLSSMVDRLTMGTIITGLFIGSSIVYYANIKPTVFGIPLLGFLGYLGAGILSTWVIWNIWRKNKR